MDAASSGQAKKLFHDFSDCVWSGVELLVDENTTVALAEVAAYLCHALEMEHALYRDPRSGGHWPPPGDATTTTTEEALRKRRAEAARRRRERARQNARTYGPDCDTIDGGSDATGTAAELDESGIGIEEAILSSLGDAYRIYRTEGDDTSTHRVGGAELDGTADLSLDGRGEAATSSLPSRVIVDTELGNGLEPPSTGMKPPNAGGGDDASSIGTERTGEGGGGEGDVDSSSKAFANEACDVDFLRKQIARRAQTIETEQRRSRVEQQQQQQQRLVDIEDTLSIGTDGDGANNTSRTKPSTSSNVSQFYSHVEQVSTERQAETIGSILGGSGGQKKTWYSKAAAAAGAGNEHGQDTIKSRLEAYVSKKAKERGDIGVGGSRQEAMPTNVQGSVRNRLLVWILVLWFVLGCIVMGGFSCYGMYVFFFAKHSVSTPSPLKNILRTVETRRTASQPPPAPTEFVVRIVREVVHVAPDGSRYEVPVPPEREDNVDVQAVEEKIAEATASAIQQAVRAHAVEL